MPRRRTHPLPLLLAGALLLAGCGGGDDDPAAGADADATAPPTVRTLSPLPRPEDPPPTGRQLADMRQSSIDASLGRMQVWIDNDTTAPVTPSRIVYRDPHFRRPIDAERLRTNPAGSERGFPVPLPARPRCDGTARPESGVVEITHGGRTERVRVTDPTDVVGRYTRSRCQELALARVADVGWLDEVTDDGSGAGAVGTLTLLVRPTGGAEGHDLVIDRVSGSHLLGSAEGPGAWAPGRRITGTDPVRIDLPLKPARCDDHAFLEGGNATAFRLHFTLDGRPGEILLRMTPAGGGNAVAFARRSCGLDAG
ncbi:hypothetical protein [Nocardioides sp. SYSU D00038]|uniref:hypothetical protein n=1 Tax=Nocardioides sp. SYSU D00038 TaxID=2812554 RepID=UPI00196727E8|nr:hypothetical protein [Nocardioides sp. SYSU D00038]